MLIERQRAQLAGADHEEDRNHCREDAPLIDVRRHHVHERDVRCRYLACPVERAELLGKLGEKWRDPLHEDERRDAEGAGNRQHGVQKRMRGEVKDRAADHEQQPDGHASFAHRQRENAARNDAEVLQGLFIALARRDLPKNP